MKELNEDFQKAVNEYIESAKEDYKWWTSHVFADKETGELSSHTKSMIEDYNGTIHYKLGKNYVKVITGTSVHSFIVLEDGGKFKKGDILKAASWASPAKNFARGNVFGSYDIKWTGA